MIAIETVIGLNAYNKGSISKHAGFVFLLSPFNLKGVNDGEPLILINNVIASNTYVVSYLAGTLQRG